MNILKTFHHVVVMILKSAELSSKMTIGLILKAGAVALILQLRVNCTVITSVLFLFLNNY